MRCPESCVSLWWHIDQLLVLGRCRASQAEAARAYKTLLTKLQGKSDLGWVHKGGAVCDFCPCLLDSVWMCDYVCLSWREVVPQHLKANLGNKQKRLKVGQPPAKRAAQQLHLERHKVGRKSSALWDGSGRGTTNEPCCWCAHARIQQEMGDFGLHKNSNTKHIKHGYCELLVCGNTHKMSMRKRQRYNIVRDYGFSLYLNLNSSWIKLFIAVALELL